MYFHLLKRDDQFMENQFLYRAFLEQSALDPQKASALIYQRTRFCYSDHLKQIEALHDTKIADYPQGERSMEFPQKWIIYESANENPLDMVGRLIIYNIDLFDYYSEARTHIPDLKQHYFLDFGLVKAYQGKGIAKEVLKEMMNFLKDKLPVSDFMAAMYLDNIASMLTAFRVGARPYGYFVSKQGEIIIMMNMSFNQEVRVCPFLNEWLSKINQEPDKLKKVRLANRFILEVRRNSLESYGYLNEKPFKLGSSTLEPFIEGARCIDDGLYRPRRMLVPLYEARDRLVFEQKINHNKKAKDDSCIITKNKMRY